MLLRLAFPRRRPTFRIRSFLGENRRYWHALLTRLIRTLYFLAIMTKIVAPAMYFCGCHNFECPCDTWERSFQIMIPNIQIEVGGKVMSHGSQQPTNDHHDCKMTKLQAPWFITKLHNDVSQDSSITSRRRIPFNFFSCYPIRRPDASFDNRSSDERLLHPQSQSPRGWLKVLFVRKWNRTYRKGKTRSFKAPNSVWYGRMNKQSTRQSSASSLFTGGVRVDKNVVPFLNDLHIH